MSPIHGPRASSAIDGALDDLAKVDERKARVVEMRVFGGLSVAESARLLGVSPETVDRDWRFARAWLQRELREVTDPRWERAVELFHSALERGPDQRDAYLRAACGSDESLYETVVGSESRRTGAPTMIRSSTSRRRPPPTS